MFPALYRALQGLSDVIDAPKMRYVTIANVQAKPYCSQPESQMGTACDVRYWAVSACSPSLR